MFSLGFFYVDILKRLSLKTNLQIEIFLYGKSLGVEWTEFKSALKSPEP